MGEQGAWEGQGRRRHCRVQRLLRPRPRERPGPGVLWGLWVLCLGARSSARGSLCVTDEQFLFPSSSFLPSVGPGGSPSTPAGIPATGSANTLFHRHSC